MPRLVIALLLCGALAVAAATRLSAAPPTTEQLRAALLKPEDAGQDFTTEFERATGDNGEIVVAQYVQLQPRQVVSVMLTDAALSTPEELARSFLQGVSASENVETLPAPAIGREPAHRRYTATARGVDIEGELIAWRQGDVLALVSLTRGTSERLWSLVDRQQARLYVTFTPVLKCATFAWQEEARAMLALDPADPHGLDPAGSGVACAQLARRPETGTPAVAMATPSLMASATPTPAPTPPLDPVRALIGQTRDICYGQYRLRTTIENAWVFDQQGGPVLGRWFVLIVWVINLGPAVNSVPLYLVNDEGQGYGVLLNGRTTTAAGRETPSFDYNQLSLPVDAMRPPVSLQAGQSARIAAAFPTSANFTPARLWAGERCPS